VRGAPLLLARYDGRFYELYPADDDRSYYDALLVGQRLYRRDLVGGDSAVVFEDTTIAALARWYGAEHPRERPLRPDEEASEDPRLDVAGEVLVLEQLGPYLSFEYRVDGSMVGSEEWHSVRRGVVDLRTGRAVSVADLVGARDGVGILAQGRALFSAALDSVLASPDLRAREAAGALDQLAFDPKSFALVPGDEGPAIVFAAVGIGKRAGGLTLELDAIEIPPPRWWEEASAALPEPGADTLVARWRRGAVAVEARLDSAEENARLVIADSEGRTWPAGRIGTPVRRLHWLHDGAADSITLRALSRAFDEAALYSEETRVASRAPRRGHARLAALVTPAPSPARRPSGRRLSRP
jgi:hypothetical protein